MGKITQIVAGLNKYDGRDACIKFLYYISLFIHGLIITTNLNGAETFLTLSKQSANCGIVLRFFEDLPAIYNLFSYLNKKHKV